MAITVAVFGPTDHLPYVAEGKYQWLHTVGDGTQVLNPAGNGVLHALHVGVIGTLAIYYDTPAGGTADTTTEIARVATTAIGRQFEGDIEYARGLTCVITGGGSDLTHEFTGRTTVANPRTFGV